MFSINDLKMGIRRWLSEPHIHISFTIDQHQCELTKEKEGVSCFLETGIIKNQVTPNTLSQWTLASLKQFSGTPVLNTEGHYLLGVWQPLSKAPDEDSEKLLAVIENLTNQASVWNDLFSLTPNNNRQGSPSAIRFRLPTRLSQQLNPV